MGTELIAKKAGTCPECKNSWKPGESIFWDNQVKNTAGFNVTCLDKKCFSEQGGQLTPKSGFGFKKGFSNTPKVDVTLIVPDVEVPSYVRNAATALKGFIKQADELVEELYKLPANDQTRGQIRSKFVDQLIAIDEIINK